MEDILYDYLSPQQYCSVALMVTNEKLDLLAETASDVSVLALNHVVRGSDLTNLYDPIGECLAEFSTYSKCNGISVLSSISQYPGPVIQIPNTTIINYISLMFDLSQDEIFQHGLLPALKTVRELDPTKTTLKDILLSSVYLPRGYEFSTLIQALRDMDLAHPTYAYTFQRVYEYSDELTALREGVLCQDFTFGEHINAILISSITIDDFLNTSGLSRDDIIAMLSSQQMPGFSANNILDCVNYRYAKKYLFVRGDERDDVIIYKMLGDSGQFRLPTTENVVDYFTDLVQEVSEESASQTVLQKALYLAASGESKVADIAAYLGQGFDSTFGSTKGLISTISSYGSSMTPGVATAMQNLFKSMVSSRPAQSRIEWGYLDTPIYDSTIGSVIVGVACTAGQAIGTMMVAFGGIIVKLAGALLLAGSFVVQGISNLLSDVADTFPDFQSDTIDRLFGYPLAQGDNLGMWTLPTHMMQHIKKYGSLKLFYPFCTIFLYNLDERGTVSYKVFINVTRTSSSGKGISFLRYTTGHGVRYDELVAPVCTVTPPSGEEHGYIFQFSNISYHRNWMLRALVDSYRHKGSADSIAEMCDVPCTPDHYNVHSKDSEDYKSLWSCIAQNAALTLLLFENTNFSSTGQVGIGVNGRHYPSLIPKDKIILHNSSSDSAASALFDAIMITTFGNIAVNDRSYDHVISTELGFDGVDLLLWNDTPDYAEMIVNRYLPWISQRITDNIGGALFWQDDWAEELCLEMPWSGFDPKYSVTPPGRSLASLIWAVILTAAIVISAVVTTVAVKMIVTRKLQPAWLSKIQAFAADRQALNDLQVRSDSDAQAKKIIAKEYFSRVRRFNLISKLLGMGGYNAMADWYEGSGTIGGTWSEATGVDASTAYSQVESTATTNGLMNDALVDDDTGQVVTLKEIRDGVSTADSDVISIKTLIKGS